MDASADKQTVRVTILSRPYTLRTSGDPRELEEAAATVNEVMLAIAGKAPNADSTHIAVLACLHLVDRLRSLERDLTELKSHVDRKSEEYAGMLERLLASAGEEL
jgi:cell division protein ZapA